MTESTPNAPVPGDRHDSEVPSWYQPYAAPGAIPTGAVPPGAVPPGWGPPAGHPFGGGPGAPPPDSGSRRRYTHPIVTAALVMGTVAASAAATHVLWPSSSSKAASPISSSTGLPAYGTGGAGSSASNTQGTGAPADVSSIAAKVDPALVDINTVLGYQGAEGAGTGIVLTSNGEILTNNHVINGATSIRVTDVGNGRTYAAKVVGYDSTQDVAVLQLVGASGLRTASIGNSGSLKVGQPVVAIGNAGGAGGTPSAAGGSITALNQSITASDQLDGTSENLTNLIETNADVQAGDSGGSLVDSAGRVIGMDTAASVGYSLQSAVGGTSQGYAIPINEAVAIARQIESGQASSTVHIGSTAFLGVLISSSPSPYSTPPGYGSYGYGSYGYGSPVSGAVVGGVVPGGAAQQAGLAAGDVITAVNGQSVTSAKSLSQTISGDRPGQSIRITWIDPSGASHTATATLQSGPPA